MTNDLKNKIAALSDFLKKKHIQYNSGGSLENFKSLPVEQQVLTVTGLTKYIDTLSACEEEGFEFSDSKRLAMAALEKLGLKVDSRFTDNLLPTDYIEMYTTDFVSTFKSLNFWGHCSYTLEELYTRHYKELYTRDEFSEALLLKAAVKIMSGETEYIAYPVPQHHGREVSGPVEYLMTIKGISTVRDENNTIVGAIINSEIIQLSEPTFPYGNDDLKEAITIPFPTKKT